MHRLPFIRVEKTPEDLLFFLVLWTLSCVKPVSVGSCALPEVSVIYTCAFLSFSHWRHLRPCPHTVFQDMRTLSEPYCFLMPVHEELCSPPPPFSLLSFPLFYPHPPFFLFPSPPILPLLLHSLETRSLVAQACLELCRTEDAIKLLIPRLHLPRTKIIGMSYCTWIIHLFFEIHLSMLPCCL